MVSANPLMAALASVFSLRTVAGTGIILPLYSYPVEGAWDDLFTALQSESALPFDVIINPNSGPGDAAQPETAYQSALKKLKKHKNVQLLGYVSTNYGDRPEDEVIQDVDTYQGWDSAYSVDGIFFDEGPDRDEYVEKYRTYAAEVNGKVVLNPGTKTADGYFEYCDQIVTYESAWTDYQEPSLSHAAQESIIIHSYTGTSSKLQDLVTGLADKGLATIYVTDLKLSEEDVYAGFGGNWDALVKDVAATDQ